MKIIIDPGHGGLDPGAVGIAGVRECDVTLDVSSRLGSILSGSHDWIMTHNGEGASLQDRCTLANSHSADLFVSIHCNAFADASAEGYEVFTSPGETGADPYATRVMDSFGSLFPGRKARTDYSDGDPDQERRFYVLIHTSMPAILVELGFITNPCEAYLLSLDDQRQLYAQAIAAAI